MPEQHTDAKNNARNKKDIPQPRRMPEYQRHKIWKAGMAGKEQIAGKNKFIDKIAGFYIKLLRRKADMGQSHKYRTDKNKQRNSFKSKRNSFGLLSKKRNNKCDKKNKTINKDQAYIQSRKIIKKKIIHRIACPNTCISSGQKIYYHACGKKQNAINS